MQTDTNVAGNQVGFSCKISSIVDFGMLQENVKGKKYSM